LADCIGATEFDARNKVLLPKPVYKDTEVKNFHIYNQFIIRVEKRDELRQFLASQSIGTEIYYPVPFHRQECFANLGYSDDEFSVANSLAETSLALPIYPELSEEQIKYVVNKIAEFINQ
ncbi:MAG TPA: DegT/DnrJ/EryC1/StrS family aminotransferase, partial [Candidatus Kapabacteria bacterium]|nr:DegT/DnrJ/EryC1/StrS family aminotransferase [Candidatus Kapabacteria bacterium]